MPKHKYKERTLQCRTCISKQRTMMINELMHSTDETDSITSVLVLHYRNDCNDDKMLFEVITNPMADITDDEYKELETKMLKIEKDINLMLEEEPHMKSISQEDLVHFDKKYSVHVSAIGIAQGKDGDDRDELTEEEIKYKIETMLNIFSSLPKDVIKDRLNGAGLTPNELKYAEKIIDEFYENNEGTGILGDIIEKKEGESFQDAIFRGIDNLPVDDDEKKIMKDRLGVNSQSNINMYNSGKKPKFYN